MSLKSKLATVLFLIVFTIFVATVAQAQAQTPATKPKKELTGRQAALDLLRLANKISDSDLPNKDEIAELIEFLSAKVLEKNASKDGRSWLCSTDAECAKLERRLNAPNNREK